MDKTKKNLFMSRHPQRGNEDQKNNSPMNLIIFQTTCLSIAFIIKDIKEKKLLWDLILIIFIIISLNIFQKNAPILIKRRQNSTELCSPFGQLFL